jgi:hypothetical protein
MEDQFTYQDFDLLIESGAQGRYRARVLRSPAGESASVQLTLPFSPMELENFLLRLGRPRRGTRGAGRPESGPLKEFGGRLYGAVFQGELRDVLLRSMSQTRAQGTGLRLRLRLAHAPELAELPWEFLYDARLNRFLAQSRHTPLVRYLDLPDPPRRLTVEGPLRLLVMISSPTGYPPLDVEQEWSLLTDSLAALQDENQVIVERLPANMSDLRHLLRREAFHVFHFVGHGYYRRDWGDGVLVMENRSGRPQEVTGEEIGGLLSEYDQTRLVVLNSCEGARTDASDPFAGVAQSLIQQGLPAVVAMQFEITDDAAIIFARELYWAIADGYPLEAALAEARGAIRDAGNPTEWGTPVLYSRAPDGHLFDMSRPGKTSKAAHWTWKGTAPTTEASATEEVNTVRDAELSGDEQPNIVEREIAVCKRFDVSPEKGLNREEASRAFSDNGISPRACGSWTQHGWIIREGDRRWLSDKGRDWVRDQLMRLSSPTPGEATGRAEPVDPARNGEKTISLGGSGRRGVFTHCQRCGYPFGAPIRQEFCNVREACDRRLREPGYRVPKGRTQDLAIRNATIKKHPELGLAPVEFSAAHASTCVHTLIDDGGGVGCELPSSHEGKHKSGDFEWPSGWNGLIYGRERQDWPSEAG